jgi:osmotically inducible lipoprotein OsmB
MTFIAEEGIMKRVLAIACVAAALMTPTVAGAGERLLDGALGAGSGAIVFGPAGALAGGLVGVVAGPSIARGLGLKGRHRHSRYARR